MVIFVSFDIGLSPLDQMQLSGSAQCEPCVFSVFEWLVYFLQHENIFIKVCALSEIMNIDSNVVQGEFYSGGRRCLT